jgi:putative endonuclease|tara:strand:+ start:807 stop:1172 length:366 start_codon:yes stop_codon:yes gene_type:complete
LSVSRQKIGEVGEQKARSFLKKNKYQILETNWRYHKCEIDIIASKGNELVFIEVKTRTNTIISEDNLISIPQQKRIIYAADYYINKNKIDLNVRFDLIFVERALKSFKFTHFKEIFTPTID